jgi:hypothetical protein
VLYVPSLKLYSTTAAHHDLYPQHALTRAGCVCCCNVLPLALLQAATPPVIPAQPAPQAHGPLVATPSPVCPVALATPHPWQPPALRSATQSTPAHLEHSTPWWAGHQSASTSASANQVGDWAMIRQICHLSGQPCMRCDVLHAALHPVSVLQGEMLGFCTGIYRYQSLSHSTVRAATAIAFC